MAKGLPKFEGKDVSSARLKLNGFGEDLGDALKGGHRVYYVVEAIVEEVNHKTDKQGHTSRIHTAKISRTCQMDTVEAQEMLAAEDERKAILASQEQQVPGQQSIDDELDAKRRAAGERE